MRFHLNLSIDHTDEERHDYIRGKPGAWARMNETAEAIRPFRSRFPNLIVHTLTTVMKENQDDILEIYDELQRRFEPDGASFNYCRGHPLDPSQTELKPETYQALARRMEEDFHQGRLTNSGTAYGAGNHILDQQVRRSVERTVAENRPQFSCVSGRLACVIYSNGDVVECEINNSKLGNLRDVDYDFQRLWFSKQADEVAARAANGCFCTARVRPLRVDHLQCAVGDQDQRAGGDGGETALMQSSRSLFAQARPRVKVTVPFRPPSGPFRPLPA